MTANSAANTATLFLGRGDGTFPEREDYGVGNYRNSRFVVVTARSGGTRPLSLALAGIPLPQCPGSETSQPSRYREAGSILMDGRLQFYAFWSMLSCMRTTIEISNELLRQAKRRAADEGASLRQVIENALRSYLAIRPRRHGYKLRWRVEKGELRPGVNLDDRDSLLDLMDRRS